MTCSEKNKLFSNILENVNNSQNNGRGVGCVKSIITYLRLNKLEDAKIVCRTDFDKIRNYPEIVKLLQQFGLVGG